MIGAFIFLGLIFGIFVGYFLFLRKRKKVKKEVLKKIKDGTLGMMLLKEINEKLEEKKEEPKEEIHTRTSEVNRMLPKEAEESNTSKVVVNKEDSIPPLSHSAILDLLPKNNKKRSRKRLRRRNRRRDYGKEREN